MNQQRYDYLICSQKVKYLTKNEAKKVVLILKRKGRKLKPYKCDNCNEWHLTTKKSRFDEKTAELQKYKIEIFKQKMGIQ